MVLYRPVGKKEYDLIRESGFSAFPPRLFWQPIFYPVLNREYAGKIAGDWNTGDKDSDYIGIVTMFEIDDAYASSFERHLAGSSLCEELWVPAEELGEFNRHILGRIKIIDVFYGSQYAGENIEIEAE